MRTVSVILIFEGMAMLIPFICAVIYKETAPAAAFLLFSIACIVFGWTMFRTLRYYSLNIKTREGYFVVFISWITVCVIGALPYAYSDCGYSFVDSLFESFAGWSTTGAWVLDVNNMPKSLILWKSVCNWLGGMGIIVLTLSIFPILGIGGQRMANAEVPGPELEKFAAKIGETAKISYRIYIVLTIVELAMLLPSMSPYNALVNTLSSISTAGIVNIYGGVSLHFTPYIKTVLVFFSIVGSINFVTYFYLYTGKAKLALQSVEVRTYIGILASASLLVAIMLTLTGEHGSFLDALGNSVTQVVSFGSTSGFTVDNINTWPSTCKIVLIMVMIIGGCGFSTSGGIKVVRVVVFWKLIKRGGYRRIHPNSVKSIMIHGKPVSTENASSITVFLMLYFALYLFACLMLSLENQDMETTLSAVLGALTNNGTGFGMMYDGYYGMFSWAGKLFCSILMLAGRLEMYAIIVLFSRSFWNSDRARS